MMKICTRSAGEIWSLHRCPTGQNSIRERAIKFDSLLHDPPIYWFNQRNNSHCIRREIGGQTPEPIVLTKIGKKEICFSLFGQVRENRKILKIYIKSARSLSKIQRNFPIFRRDIFDKIFHVVFFSQESCQNVESLRIKIREDFKKFRKKIRESPRFRSKLSIFGYREFEILKLARISNNFSYNFWQEQFTKYFRNFPSCLGHEWINPRIFRTPIATSLSKNCELKDQNSERHWEHCHDFVRNIRYSRDIKIGGNFECFAAWKFLTRGDYSQRNFPRGWARPWILHAKLWQTCRALGA